MSLCDISFALQQLKNSPDDDSLELRDHFTTLRYALADRELVHDKSTTSLRQVRDKSPTCGRHIPLAPNVLVSVVARGPTGRTSNAHSPCAAVAQ